MIDGGPSDRVLVARLARDVALSTPGVVALDAGAGGLFTTAGGGARVPGVTSAVAPGGGYDVALRIVCELVELRPLADRVRASIGEAARRAALVVSSVTIEVVDVVVDGVA